MFRIGVVNDKEEELLTPLLLLLLLLLPLLMLMFDVIVLIGCVGIDIVADPPIEALSR